MSATRIGRPDLMAAVAQAQAAANQQYLGIGRPLPDPIRRALLPRPGKTQAIPSIEGVSYSKRLAALALAAQQLAAELEPLPLALDATAKRVRARITPAQRPADDELLGNLDALERSRVGAVARRRAAHDGGRGPGRPGASPIDGPHAKQVRKLARRHGSKICKGCRAEKDIASFCDASGTPNPRGRYCRDCHAIRLREEELAALEAEGAAARKFQIIFGEWWKHYAYPTAFTASLYRERDLCPYCGKHLPPQYLPASHGALPFRGRAHIDHMDPLSRGGEDSIRNAVYVCDSCNDEKGERLFVDWLESLLPEYREMARQIYVDKHGHDPEAFMPGVSQSRMEGIGVELEQTEEELRTIYPVPIVSEPPREAIITNGLEGRAP